MRLCANLPTTVSCTLLLGSLMQQDLASPVVRRLAQTTSSPASFSSFSVTRAPPHPVELLGNPPRLRCVVPASLVHRLTRRRVSRRPRSPRSPRDLGISLSPLVAGRSGEWGRGTGRTGGKNAGCVSPNFEGEATKTTVSCRSTLVGPPPHVS